MWRSSVRLYWYDAIRMVFQCLWSDFCLTFTTGTPHRADIKSNKFSFFFRTLFVTLMANLLPRFWCVLFIAFQLLRFYWNDLLDWGFILVFFCTCCCKNFSCYQYILSTGKIYWLKEKRMSVSLILFFYTRFKMNKNVCKLFHCLSLLGRVVLFVLSLPQWYWGSNVSHLKIAALSFLLYMCLVVSLIKQLKQIYNKKDNAYT